MFGREVTHINSAYLSLNRVSALAFQLLTDYNRPQKRRQATHMSSLIKTVDIYYFLFAATSALMRRMPAEEDFSDVILNSTSSPVCSTCGPPQISEEKLLSPSPTK